MSRIFCPEVKCIRRASAFLISVLETTFPLPLVPHRRFHYQLPLPRFSGQIWRVRECVDPEDVHRPERYDTNEFIRFEVTLTRVPS